MIADCPGCMAGKHEEHVEHWGTRPEGIIDGEFCYCKGDCAERARAAFDEFFGNMADIIAEKDAPACDGDGGSVFTYEGPQFGAHIEEEPCRKCGGWHESPGERETRLRWENRRRPIRDLIRRLRHTRVTSPGR